MQSALPHAIIYFQTHGSSNYFSNCTQIRVITFANFSVKAKEHGDNSARETSRREGDGHRQTETRTTKSQPRPWQEARRGIRAKSHTCAGIEIL